MVQEQGKLYMQTFRHLFVVSCLGSLRGKMEQETAQPFELRNSVLCSLAPQARSDFPSIEILGIRQAQLAVYFVKMSCPIH